MADLLDDQTGHLGRRDDALRGGRARAERPGEFLHSGVRRRPGLCGRVGPAASHGGGDRAGAGLAPAHPHRRPDLWVPPGASGGCHVPGGWLRMVKRRPRWTWRRPATSGPACRCCSSRARSGTTRSPQTSSAGWSRSSPGPASTSSWPPASWARWACPAADYHRFTQMLLASADSPAGELDGVQLLSPRTVRYMTRNHLPGGFDLDSFGRPLYAEFPFRGVGFGLGFAVVTDPVAGRVVCSEGEFSWGGAPAPRSGPTRKKSWPFPSSRSCSLPAPTGSGHSYASSSTRHWLAGPFPLPPQRAGDWRSGRSLQRRGHIMRARDRAAKDPGWGP